MVNKKWLLVHLLGLLTPEKINSLTTQYRSQNRVDLMDFALKGILPQDSKHLDEMEKDLQKTETTKAKIIPISGYKKEKPFQMRAGRECFELLGKGNLRPVKELLSRRMRMPSYSEVAKVQEKKTSSIFILEEKERLNESQKKLKSREIIETYHHVAATEIREASARRKNEHPKMNSYSSGVLINKKSA